MSPRIEKILNKAKADKKLHRLLRLAYLEGMEKSATGILHDFSGNVVDYKTRSEKITERGFDDKPRDELYGLKHEDFNINDVREHSHSLSTRYVPDKPGVQSQRIKGTDGGVYMDPYTNRIYDWNKGFKTEDGREFGPGSVEYQTDMFSYSSCICDPDKLKK